MKKIEVVGAVIVNEKTQILCALRSEFMSMANYWEFPGGKREPGEDLEGALVREIDEELGCRIEVKKKILDHYHPTETMIVHLHTFLAEVIDAIPKPREHAEIKWVYVNELSQLHWAPADLPTVTWLQKNM